MTDKTDILGIKVDVIDRPGLLDRIEWLVAAGRPARVNNVNIHACNLAYDDAEFREILNASEGVFCDGFGVKLGAWLLGRRLGERMTPPDWIDALFELGARRGWRFYFLGDTEAVVGRFAETVRDRFPRMEVCGFHHGFFEIGGVEDGQVRMEINRLMPDVVLTAMGMPRQEKWAAAFLPEAGRGVFIATGALFRWYTGIERRCPHWMSDHGLEWLARLVQKPGTHFRRYVVGIPLFFGRVLKQRLAPFSKRG